MKKFPTPEEFCLALEQCYDQIHNERSQRNWKGSTNPTGEKLIKWINEGFDLSQTYRDVLLLDQVLAYTIMRNVEVVSEVSIRLINAVLDSKIPLLLEQSADGKKILHTNFGRVLLILNQTQKGNLVKRANGQNLLHVSAKENLEFLNDLCGNSFWEDYEGITYLLSHEQDDEGNLPLHVMWEHFKNIDDLSIQERLHWTIYVHERSQKIWGVNVHQTNYAGKSIDDLAIDALKERDQKMIEKALENTFMGEIYNNCFKFRVQAIKQQEELQLDMKNLPISLRRSSRL